MAAETKEQISKALGILSASEVKDMFLMLSKFTFKNPDFQYVISSDIKDYTTRITGIDYSSLRDKMLNPSSRQLLWSMPYDTKKLTKAKAIGLLSSLLSDDTLFEGLCLAIPLSDALIEGIMKMFGCSQKYELLKQDPVFSRRMRYKRKLETYATAAVNLYGAIPLEELAELIRYYEERVDDDSGYSRDGGSYSATMFFKPQGFDPYFLEHVLRCCNSRLLDITFDLIIVHPHFKDEAELEYEEFDEYSDAHPDMDFDKTFDAFFDAAKDVSSYRFLLDIAHDKPRYKPSLKEFLKYNDMFYRPANPAERRLRDYLVTVFRPGIAARAKKEGENFNDFVTQMMDEAFLCVNLDDDWDPVPHKGQQITKFLDAMRFFGVDATGLRDLNRLLKCFTDFLNSTKCWANNGYSPNEFRALFSDPGISNPSSLPPLPGKYLS